MRRESVRDFKQEAKQGMVAEKNLWWSQKGGEIK
jgi:hypothetical protein